MHGDTRCADDARSRAAVGRGDRRLGRAARRPDGAAGRARGPSTSSSRCCTARTARTAPLQGLLELAGIPYVGSGVFASAAAMDKHHMKRLLHDGRARACRRTSSREPVGRSRPRSRELGLPVFVKPARGGSSIGISQGDRPVGTSMTRSRRRSRHDPKALVEAAVVGREIECGVLAGIGRRSARGVAAGGDPDRARAPTSMTSRRSTCRTPAPSSTSRRTCPSDVIDDVAGDGRRGLRGTGLRGSRAGRLLPRRRAASLLVNEVNTMPGFTPVSMFPQMWAATGVDYPTWSPGSSTTRSSRGTGLR